MAKNNKMIGHWVGGIRRFEPIAQLRSLTERRFCEMDVINIGPFVSSGGRGLLFACGGFWRRLSVNKCSR